MAVIWSYDEKSSFPCNIKLSDAVIFIQASKIFIFFSKKNWKSIGGKRTLSTDDSETNRSNISLSVTEEKQKKHKSAMTKKR